MLKLKLNDEIKYSLIAFNILLTFTFYIHSLNMMKLKEDKLSKKLRTFNL